MRGRETSEGRKARRKHIEEDTQGGDHRGGDTGAIGP